MTEKKKPANELRLGRLKAVIWSNDTENGERYNVQFKRIYRIDEAERGKKDNGWRESDSFGREDILLLAKLADQAHTWMYEQTAQTQTKEAA